MCLRFRINVSYSSMLVILIYVLSFIILSAVVFLVIPGAGSKFAILFLIFAIAFMYASFRSTSFPYPYGDFVEAKLKLISDLRVKGNTVQFTARVKKVSLGQPGEAEKQNIRFPNRKILLNIPAVKSMPQRGDTVNVTGVFMDLPFERSDSYARYLASKSIGAIIEGSSGGLKILKYSKKYSVINISNKLKKYVKKVNDRLLLWPQSEFAFAIFTGNKDGLPPFIIETFRGSGTMHLLAVSGLHIGFLVMFFFLILRVLRIDRTVSYILLVGAVVFYMIFIGDAPSVKRASIMVLLGIFIFIFDRDRNYLNVLSITFNILWVINPLIITNPGFLLSFSATFAILFLAPHFMKIFESIMPPIIAGPLAVSSGVQIYLFPVLLSYFGVFPYITVVANLPIVPLAGISLGLEMIYLALYLVFLPLAVIIAETNLFVITTILRLNMVFSRVPPISVSSFPPYLIILYFALITAAIVLLTRKRQLAWEQQHTGEQSNNSTKDQGFLEEHGKKVRSNIF
jgi:competence protein ComEC